MGPNQESHPESHFRVPAIVNALEKIELNSKSSGNEVVELQSINPASLEDITLVHTKSHVTGLEKAMDKASEQGLIYIEGSVPTYATSTESLVVAGVGIALVDAVAMFQSGTPPGHHEIPKGPMGFCVFGNITIAARYMQRVHGLRRVFIIDFDVHHGNGTNDAFYDDPDIVFLSTHQDGSYPGTGKADEIGTGAAEGATLNLRLPGGSGYFAMRNVFEDVIAPCAQRLKLNNLLVSAGDDTHVLDPVANLQFTTLIYYTLANSIKRLAQQLCGGRCVFFLEGGHNLQSLCRGLLPGIPGGA